MIGNVEIRKPVLPALDPKSTLADYAVGSSTILFDLQETPVDFLLHDNWTQQPEYTTVKDLLQNLSRLNDTREQTLGMATRINTCMQR